jgi:hydroxyethylthiazole kinase-like uncharacterized protein yjeF
MVQRVRPLARQEVRLLDERAVSELGLPTLVLMENAGRGAAALLAEQTTSVIAQSAVRPSADVSPEERSPLAGALPRVLVLCGPGNNGGDGGVVARHLDAWGFPVRVVWLSPPAELRGDARTQWQILDRSGVEQILWHEQLADELVPETLDRLINDADWLVDGILGTGLARPVEGVFRLAIEAVNRAAKPVLALDLPSGLDTDRGIPLGVAVLAQLTATFVAPKLGFSALGARTYTGKVVVIEIGLPRSLLAPLFEESS